MTWTLTNLVIEIIAGVVGGVAFASLANEHSSWVIGHALAGAIGGALSGYFLQSLVAGVVDINGDFHQTADPVSQWFVQALAGAGAGAVASMAAGMIKHSVEQHQPKGTD